jgi:type I restriction enzyme, S subunit
MTSANGWPVVPLGEVLQLQRRWIKLQPTDMYREIGIRSFGNGIFHKAPIAGSTLGNKRVLRIEPGDLVFNNVFAWEGAVAVAGPQEAGMIGSHRFVTYTVDPTRSTARFLRLFFTTEQGREILLKASPGSAGRNKTLGLDRFIANSIPLPPLDEQRRIVSRLDALVTKIEETKRLRNDIRIEHHALFTSIVSRILDDLPYSGKLGDILLSPPRNGWSARCDGLATGTPILSLSAVTGFSYRSDQYKWTSEPTSQDAHYWLSPGDLLISRSNTPDLVGHAAIYNGKPTPCIYSDLMMMLPIDAQRFNTQFVHYVLQTKKVREFIKSNAKGTSPTMKKISQGTVIAIPFPTDCSKPHQVAIVNRLNSLRTALHDVGARQADIADEINALLPSILDRAFKGEL